jgi:hypothetical protein
LIHEFHLSPPGTDHGISCDANGAFIGKISLLRRSVIDGRDAWEARERADLSKEIGRSFGLPIDMSSKMGGVKAIANALNEGDVARAQIATVLLGIPDLPVLSKAVDDPGQLIKCVRDLQNSGLLKADWDSNEHPRWPAGAPDSQGGQFAPKDDDTGVGQTTDTTAPPRSSHGIPFEIGPSPRQRFYGPDVPSAIPPDAQADSESMRPNFDDDIYASHDDSARSIRVASTNAAAINATTIGEFISGAKPKEWANPIRLFGGALKLESGDIITAAALLTSADIQRERAAIDAAFSKFGFDPSNAADVLAIRAYVWAQHYAPMNYYPPKTKLDVPWGGPQLESVSQSIMALELARPGTLSLAMNGDAASKKYLDFAVEDGMQNGAILESRARPPSLPAALQTTSEAARAALNLRTNDQMQAHHLIPANVWETRSDITMLAHEAGWEQDSSSNLIELPANAETQAKMEAEGVKLPIHSSSHNDYDAMTLGKIIIERAKYGDRLAPAQARAIFETVSTKMRTLIIEGTWMPRLR